MPGMLDGKELTVVDVYEAVGAYDSGQLSLEELKNIEECSMSKCRVLWRNVYSKYNGINI